MRGKFTGSRKGPVTPAGVTKIQNPLLVGSRPEDTFGQTATTPAPQKGVLEMMSDAGLKFPAKQTSPLPKSGPANITEAEKMKDSIGRVEGPGKPGYVVSGFTFKGDRTPADRVKIGAPTVPLTIPSKLPPGGEGHIGDAAPINVGGTGTEGSMVAE